MLPRRLCWGEQFTKEPNSIDSPVLQKAMLLCRQLYSLDKHLEKAVPRTHTLARECSTRLAECLRENCELPKNTAWQVLLGERAKKRAVNNKQYATRPGLGAALMGVEHSSEQTNKVKETAAARPVSYAWYISIPGIHNIGPRCGKEFGGRGRQGQG